MSQIATHITKLLTALFLFAIMLSGCAKEELSVPVTEESTYKSMQIFDESMEDFDSRHDADVDANDGITDDEDDEDDKDRRSNK